jgi:serine/threonine protein kinase
MARLHAVDACRDLVVFPICVRGYNDDPSYSCIVFPRLGEEYQIGLPETRGDRVEFFAKLRSAVRAFHEAGVVHLDFYLSNIMWRKGPDGIRIKVIDWDPAHFLEEKLFASARERLDKNYRSSVRDKVMAMDSANLSVGSRDYYRTQMRYFDISVIVALEKCIDDPALQARSKAELDKACYNVLNAYANASY